MIVVLTGASGAGKSTIGELLRKRFGSNLKPVVSYTTRERKDSDPPGEYVYVSRDEFDRMKRAGEFIWDVCPHGTDYYGTLFSSLEETNQEPNTIFLMILEPDSVGTLYIHKDRMGLKIAPFHIISPPVEELRRRLENRAKLDREKKVAMMRVHGIPEPDIWEWLKDKAAKDRVVMEGRIHDCLKWDERASKSKIPYVFVNYDMAYLGEEAVKIVVDEIVNRISAQ